MMINNENLKVFCKELKENTWILPFWPYYRKLEGVIFCSYKVTKEQEVMVHIIFPKKSPFFVEKTIILYFKVLVS